MLGRVKPGREVLGVYSIKKKSVPPTGKVLVPWKEIRNLWPFPEPKEGG